MKNNLVFYKGYTDIQITKAQMNQSCLGNCRPCYANEYLNDKDEPFCLNNEAEKIDLDELYREFSDSLVLLKSHGDYHQEPEEHKLEIQPNQLYLSQAIVPTSKGLLQVQNLIAVSSITNSEAHQVSCELNPLGSHQDQDFFPERETRWKKKEWENHQEVGESQAQENIKGTKQREREKWPKRQKQLKKMPGSKNN